MTLDVLLREQIEHLLQVARGAMPGPWAHVDYAGSDYHNTTYMGCGSVVTMADHVLGGDVAAPNGDLYPRSGYSPFEDMRFIATFSPDVVIRFLERDLRTLERHRPLVALRHVKACIQCPGIWPCEKILDMADVYGIQHG